ncbi:MAG: alpha-glycosidase, partial [Bacilli bacterium]|nr:alpha-glycosidase [Bacilli bacterium]
IYPERFANGNKENDPKDVLEWGSVQNVKNNMFFGGDLEGVIEKLDYLANLGINGIYFTPIFTSPSSHKYDITNYFEVDPQFGDINILKTLVKEAHKRRIRVMLDAVFNHCSFYHPFFQDVLKNGENSQYKDYFHIKRFPVFEGNPKDFHFDDENNVLNYDTFAFTPFMPKWNTVHPKVKEYLLDVAKFWIKECDIDAWRLDVSNEVDHAFWRAFRKVCDETKPDFFIVGENWDDAYAWLQPDQMHSVMNYEFMFPVWSFFGHRSIKATEFKNQINKLLCLYPKNISEYLFNLLDSHDTTRILNICQGKKQLMKLAYVFQMTIGGTPVVYYGDEVGLAGGHDPDNRRCMIWDEKFQDLDMFKHIQRLISLRKTYPLMRELDIKWVDTNDATNHLIYKKQTKDDTLYIVINNQNQHLNLMHEELVGDFYDVYNDKIITIKSSYIVNPYGFLILKKLNNKKDK